MRHRGRVSQLPQIPGSFWNRSVLLLGLLATPAATAKELDILPMFPGKISGIAAASHSANAFFKTL
jgi:hypothetical protein